MDTRLSCRPSTARRGCMLLAVIAMAYTGRADFPQAEMPPLDSTSGATDGGVSMIEIDANGDGVPDIVIDPCPDCTVSIDGNLVTVCPRPPGACRTYPVEKGGSVTTYDAQGEPVRRHERHPVTGGWKTYKWNRQKNEWEPITRGKNDAILLESMGGQTETLVEPSAQGELLASATGAQETCGIVFNAVVPANEICAMLDGGPWAPSAHISDAREGVGAVIRLPVIEWVDCGAAGIGTGETAVAWPTDEWAWCNVDTRDQPPNGRLVRYWDIDGDSLADCIQCWSDSIEAWGAIHGLEGTVGEFVPPPQ